nr:hypothetical protein CFP56_28798 [Quercus suber]
METNQAPAHTREQVCTARVGTEVPSPDRIIDIIPVGRLTQLSEPAVACVAARPTRLTPGSWAGRFRPRASPCELGSLGAHAARPDGLELWPGSQPHVRAAHEASLHVNSLTMLNTRRQRSRFLARCILDGASKGVGEILRGETSCSRHEI